MAETTNHLNNETLDAILATQLLIAWAGEGRCEPRRLGWWDTDIVDPASGGDLMARLAPRTAEWASLECVLEAARRTDASLRGKLAKPDHMRSPFFLGFDVDEQLEDRLAFLKRSGQSPKAALGIAVDAAFSSQTLEASLKKESAEYAIVPGARQMKSKAPAAPLQVIAQLASALFPIADQYPLPFFRLES